MIAPSVVEQPCVLLDGITWETFERILHELGDNRSSLTKLPIYAALGVREVWRYTGSRVLLYHCEAGEARLAEASRIFLGLNVQDMHRFLELRPTMIQPDWEDHIMAWAQQHITLAPLPSEQC